MSQALALGTIETAITELFPSGGRGWEPHDPLIAALAARLAIPRREVERQLDRLVSGGWLDAITICHCPPGQTRMVVEAGYQPGSRLRR